MPIAQPSVVRCNVPLAPLTTLEIGGNAHYFAAVDTLELLLTVLRWASASQIPILVLGGGSNILIADDGYHGLVLQYCAADWRADIYLDEVLVHVAAGVPWDELVAFTTKSEWTGLECLSGIPGWTGAVPIQNVGAYGQEIADTLIEVEAVHIQSGSCYTLSNQECGFGYRESKFKTVWHNQYVIIAVRFKLRRCGSANTQHAALAALLGDGDHSSQAVREAVMALRRGKSMVYDTADPNHRSAGSFFLNPEMPQALSEE